MSKEEITFDIPNNAIPREIKDICGKCEDNIHCQNKGCAFRSLGNEYCDVVLNATKLYLKLQQENKQLKEQIVIMGKYLELIYDLGYDYDGFNQVDSLKTLIDELVKYASFGRVCNLTEPIYENNGVSYNILHQELEKSDSSE